MYYVFFGWCGEIVVYDLDVYVNNVKYTDNLMYFKYVDRLNQIPRIEIDFLDIAESEPNIGYGKPIFIKSANNDAFVSYKLMVTEPKNKSDFGTGIIGEGWVERKLHDFLVVKTTSADSSSQAGRPQYNSVAINTIISEQLAQYTSGVSSGVVSTEKINIRSESDKLISFFYGCANVSGTDFYASYTGTNLVNSFVNIGDKGTDKSATVSLNISGANQNCEATEKTKRFDLLKNFVKLFGYGDGINQLESVSFHATSRRSKLRSDITDTQNTLPLISVSGFPNNGSVWVGCEKCNYNERDDTTNTLKQVTRGVAFQGNVKKAYAHSVNSPVYDGQFTDTSPQSIGTGSSINTHGKKMDSFEAKEIIDQSTLDIICEKILLERKGKLEDGYAPPESILVYPEDYVDIMEKVVVGDEITINDDVAGVVGKYRVYGLTLINDSGVYSLELEISNATQNVLKEIKDDADKGITLSKYMQGATNIFNIPTYENCDNSKPLNLRFYIPAETVAINSIKLSFKIKPFRAYSSSTAAESTHTHGIPSLTVNQHSHSIPSLTVNSHSHSIPSLSVSGTTTQSSTSNITFAGEYNPSNVASPFGDTGSTTIPIGTSWTPIMQVNVSNIFNDSVETALTFASRDSTSNFLVRVRLFDGSYYYPNSSGTAVQIWSHRHSTTTFESGYGSTYLRLPAQGFYTISGTFTVQAYKSTSAPTVYASGYIGVLKSHKHPIPSLTVNSTSTVSSTSGSSASTTATNTSANASSTTSSNTTTAGSSHVHGVGYAISENSLVNPSVVVTCGPEGSESAVGTYTTDQVNLNITDKITQGTGWYNVKFVPNQNMRIEANVYVQIYINSKVV